MPRPASGALGLDPLALIRPAQTTRSSCRVLGEFFSRPLCCGPRHPVHRARHLVPRGRAWCRRANGEPGRCSSVRQVRQECSRLTRQCCHTFARRHWGVRRPTAAPLEEESPARPPPPSRYRRPLDVGGGPRCRLSNPLVILGEGGLSAARSSLSSHTRRLCLSLCGRILSLHNNGVLPLWVHHGSSES